jgi:hypothetical protein
MLQQKHARLRMGISDITGYGTNFKKKIKKTTQYFDLYQYFDLL